MNIFWFRRDLRIEDNTAFSKALENAKSVLPVFIFDEDILNELDPNDSRVNFIYQCLGKINTQLFNRNSSVLVLKGQVESVWAYLTERFPIQKVYFNHDYEPYARKRDKKVINFLKNHNIQVETYKDQVIFEKSEITKKDGTPYTVYTPYKNKWLEKYVTNSTKHVKKEPKWENLCKSEYKLPSLKSLNFMPSAIKVKPWDLSQTERYDEFRNFPELNATSALGPHLRFGTVSIRKLADEASRINQTFLSELIWREFFMQILWHFPESTHQNFKSKYDGIQWRNNSGEFKKWCAGQTGYPIVDAGMRELNQTGYMHNRVRMITASFLIKHLLIDWRWGEAYFASKLLDFELSSNVGNWQWAAGTGCDSAPYFRVFNPYEQVKKFDKNFNYIKKWVPEFQELTYPRPIVEHKKARLRALETYKKGLNV
ncbi:MAG: deoxyribodipyrimidine photolyase [Flavobacteriales bacterium]|nr:deoxyribodipyrimidine photolyase [Flavobacteriales bacterium]|tara:strand:- start:10037 stop:11317 length:1281 start_codon:yes stop_codon:yes gene_type:complete